MHFNSVAVCKGVNQSDNLEMRIYLDLTPLIFLLSVTFFVTLPTDPAPQIITAVKKGAVCYFETL
jgi:hypothetical protein